MNAEFFSGIVEGIGGHVRVDLVSCEGDCWVELQA
jgi:hypothetical protein